MRLLDLFCGAGGAAYGYHLAGFGEIVGVDTKPQPRYPFEFVQADALEFVAEHGREFDVIHASPPCQAYSRMKAFATGQHPELIEPIRLALLAVGKSYVIENVPGSPLQNPLLLCGTMFGLNVIRHRLFETRPVIWFPPAACAHERKTARQGYCSPEKYICVTGNFPNLEFASQSMGIDWMNRAELAQSIPPAYTEWIGKKLLDA